MIYDGKGASLSLQEALRKRVTLLAHPPVLAVLSVASHPSITSFITIKRKFGEALGVTVEEHSFQESFGEEALIREIKKLGASNYYTGLIVQLPLPPSYNTKKVLDAIPEELDVDVLGVDAWNTFIKDGTPVPPVAGAVAYILSDTHTEIINKNVVIVGQGNLVGIPVTEWFKHQNITPYNIDITTSEEERLRVYKDADIVISGIGKPHYLKKEFFKEGVILIDAGTSEQAGVLSGDCDPLCATIASIITPVPGGVGPLTVAHLFKNLIEVAEKKQKGN